MENIGKKLIVIVGVTGTQGASVASTFLQHSDWRVRGISRNVRSEKARAAEAKGIEIVYGNLEEVDSLEAAFLGAHAIFVATDYFSIVAQESTGRQAEAINIPVDRHAYDIEVQQGVNAAIAASQPKILETLERYVFSSLPNVSRLSQGKYTRVYEFDSKGAILAHIRSDLPRLNRITSTVTLGYFAENWFKFPMTGPQKLDNGTYLFEYVAPSNDVSSVRELAYVAAASDNGKFVDALVRKLQPGANIQGVGDPMTPVDFAALWGRVKGVQTRAKAVTAENFAAGVPDALRAGVVDLFKFQSEYNYFESDTQSIRPHDVGIVTTSMEKFVRGLDWTG